MTTERDPIETSGTSGTGLGTDATTGRPMVGVMGADDTEGGDKLGQAAGDIADRVSGTLSTQANSTADDQLTRAGDMLDHVAGAVRRSGDDLRGEQPQVAGYVDMAAGQVEKAAQFLREADLDKILHETESFARRQPAVFVGAALALGFAASRFLKASPSSGGGQDRYTSSYSTPMRRNGDSGYAYGRYASSAYTGGETGYDRA